MTFPPKVFVVAHTHWDREWYLSKASFQMLNVDMMERLLEILRTQEDYTAFLLDGQLIALEDFLEVCPGRREEIIGHVRQGRLAIGPWYVLPDEFLASGEAHIRNCIEGMRVAEGLGGGTKLGYLPDSFGHPSQMAQIISGLGMEELVFWRGPGPEIRHAEFIWSGKDGSSILALNMAYGYSNAACLPEDRAARAKRLDYEAAKAMELSALGLALLMNGTDHIAPEARLPRWIAEYRQDRPGAEIHQTTLGAYVAEAKARARRVDLQKVSGELRSGYRAYLLGDTLSTRTPIKQRQQLVEVLLESWLEPALTMLALEGKLTYPSDSMRYLWRCALQNLPHDSICGCSMDEVHREMMIRYQQIDDIGVHLQRKLQQALRQDGAGHADGSVVVFQSQLGECQTAATVTLRRDLHPLRYVDYEQDQKLLEFTGDSDVPFPTGVEFIDGQGRIYAGCVLRAWVTDTLDSRLHAQPLMHRSLMVEAAFAPRLPSLGYARFAYRFLYGRNELPPALENEYFEVWAAADGTLNVYDKAAGRWYRGLNRLCDTADVGDEYTADALPGDTPVTMAADSVTVSAGPNQLTITGTLWLPVKASADRRSRLPETVACTVTTTATLLPGVQRIDIRTRIENRAKDHKLTARFPLGCQALRCVSDSLFCMEERKIARSADAARYEGWRERPNNSFFLKRVAGLTDGTAGIALFSRGLFQFEVEQDEAGDALSLTLLRCVGWLSRNDLRSRDGNGGWSIETPEAQEQGEREFHYAIMPFAGRNLPLHALYREAAMYAAPPLALEIASQPPGPPVSFAAADHPAIFCSAFKAAECGEGYILRLHNMSDELVQANLTLPEGISSVRRVSLDERMEGEAPLPLRNGQAAVAFRPWQVLTLSLR